MHSVCQYFPSAEYLRRVVEGMVRGGQTGRAGVHWRRAKFRVAGSTPSRQAGATRAGIVAAGGTARADSTEHGARDGTGGRPGIFPCARGGASGRAPGGMSAAARAFAQRGDAVPLRCDPARRRNRPDLVPARWLDWQADGLDLASLCRELEEARPDVLAVHTIPNARVRWEIVAQTEMDSATPPATAGELRGRVAGALAAGPGVDPEDLWAWPRASGTRRRSTFRRKRRARTATAR